VRADKASFTARRVAAQRARLQRPCTPEGRPEAEQRLHDGLRSAWTFTALDSGRMRNRTRWFDDAVLDAISGGVTQVVILGAGYDGRALRFAQSGVRWIEVDHPATQADKRRRVEALGVPLPHLSFVAVDLIHDDLDGALRRARHDDREATLFISEGLLGYLPLETVQSLFALLGRRATADSRLAANFRIYDPTAGLGAIGRSVVDGILSFVGEHRLTTFQSGQPEELLAEAGWTIIRSEVSDRTRTDGGSYGYLVLATPAI
jgi:methyltransferase (TIGR00027 family)